MQPRVSIATLALAVAVMVAELENSVEARPMHAAIVSKYHRYLEEKEAITGELNEWMKKYGPKGPKNGFIPVTESRSLDDELEDQKQRFYLTKEQIMEAREANPMAEFTTDGPFTLMTVEEFKQFLSNTHVNDSDKKTDAPSVEKPTTLSENEKNTPSSEDNESKNNDSTSSKTEQKTEEKESKTSDKNDQPKKKTWAPAAEGPLIAPAIRRLRDAGKSQYAFNGGDYSTNGERGFQSTSENYIQNSQQQTYQSQTSQQTYQANTANTGSNGGGTNQGWNFGDVSTGDSAQVAGVSGGSDGDNNGNWWGTNGWGGNNWWSGSSNWWNNGGNGNNQWTQPPSGSQWSNNNQNNQWTPPPNNDWNPPAGSSNTQWTDPNSNYQPQTPTTPAPTNAPVTDPPIPPTQAPAPDPPMTDPPTNPPTTKAPTTRAPKTRAPATAAPVPAAKSTSTTSDTTSANDSDSDSTDWSKSACVNPPGLQGQCGSCWAFATVGALEAAHCIANGDKKAATYSEQQLVSCDKKDFGCNGGAPVYAMEYVRDNGICTEASYPYTSVDGGNAAACSNSCTPVKSGITDIVQLKSGDESALLGALKKQPVIVSVVSDTSAWKQYKSGVITSCETTTVDHAVLAVGYDATTIKIKNSWGTDWGEDGYVRISRNAQGMGTCSVLTDMSYPKV
ncbi:hypothetical protein DVH05_025140 [Phytophthora capsici]|nr:hypothetical protein DVH05_025140 [Phytophthora capsici]|eukprot:jgi/Phyca11/503215/fgenesh2_kg.PHYCAscaffold_3_\